MRIEPASERQAAVEKENAARKQAIQEENNRWMQTAFSTVTNFDDIYSKLSSA